MVRALVHTVVENRVAFTTAAGILPCSLPLWRSIVGAETVLLAGQTDLGTSWVRSIGESDTIRARTNEPMESSRPVWRPVILLAPMLMSTGSSMI